MKLFDFLHHIDKHSSLQRCAARNELIFLYQIYNTEIGLLMLKKELYFLVEKGRPFLVAFNVAAASSSLSPASELEIGLPLRSPPKSSAGS